MGALCASVDVCCLCKHAVETLHDQLRDCVDLMGIGLGAPRADTVAEEGTAITKDQPKDIGDVRSAPPALQGHTARRRKTTPFGINFARRLVIYWATQSRATYVWSHPINGAYAQSTELSNIV